MGQHAIADGSEVALAHAMAGCPLGTWNLIEGFLYPTYQPANQFEAVWTSNKSMGNVWDASPVGFIFIPCLAHF